MLTGLTHAHEGLAYLFVLSTFTSMALSPDARFGCETCLAEGWTHPHAIC